MFFSCYLLNIYPLNVMVPVSLVFYIPSTVLELFCLAMTRPFASTDMISQDMLQERHMGRVLNLKTASTSTATWFGLKMIDFFQCSGAKVFLFLVDVSAK